MSFPPRQAVTSVRGTFVFGIPPNLRDDISTSQYQSTVELGTYRMTMTLSDNNKEPGRGKDDYCALFLHFSTDADAAITLNPFKDKTLSYSIKAKILPKLCKRSLPIREENNIAFARIIGYAEFCKKEYFHLVQTLAIDITIKCKKQTILQPQTCVYKRKLSYILQAVGKIKIMISSGSMIYNHKEPPLKRRKLNHNAKEERISDDDEETSLSDDNEDIDLKVKRTKNGIKRIKRDPPLETSTKSAAVECCKFLFLEMSDVANTRFSNVWRRTDNDTFVLPNSLKVPGGGTVDITLEDVENMVRFIQFGEISNVLVTHKHQHSYLALKGLSHFLQIGALSDYLNCAYL